MGVAFFEGAAGVRRGFRSVCSWCPSQNVRKGSLKVEGYAVAELAARADVVAPGLGRPVGKLVALAGELTGPGAGRRSFDEIEQKVIVQGRELLQVILQYVMDQLAAAEPRLRQVTGADGVRRTCIRLMRCWACRRAGIPGRFSGPRSGMRWPGRMSRRS